MKSKNKSEKSRKRRKVDDWESGREKGKSLHTCTRDRGKSLHTCMRDKGKSLHMCMRDYL